MFDSTELKVGDVFYGVYERNQSFHRKKIHQEINGQDWFRYDKPIRTFELITYTVLGILTKSLEGKWKHGEEYELETEFYLQSMNETHVQNYTTTINADDEEKYFVDKDDALEYIKVLEEKARKADFDWGEQ